MEHTNTVDEEIEKYLPLLSDEQKKILLKQIKAMLDKVTMLGIAFLCVILNLIGAK